MAANTSGNKNLDYSIVTGELCLEALEFTKILLKKMDNLSQNYLWERLLMK